MQAAREKEKRMFKLRTGASRRRGGIAVLTTIAVVSGLGLTTRPALASPGVDPGTVNLTLGPGGSSTVDKVVHTSPVPPKPDVVFLADTTGSMEDAIGNVRTNAVHVMNSVLSAQPSAQFAAAEYRDVDFDAVSFAVDQNLTANQTAVQNGINTWVAGGGDDIPEDGLNALYQIATGAVPFRAGSTRIVAIFGDAPSHEPSGGHSLADTVAALQAAQVRVVAVNVGETGAGLNENGQIEAVTSATSGIFLDNVAANQVADAILAGIQAIQVTVTPHVVSCDTALSLTFNPGSRVVASGGDAGFAEDVHVAANAAAGTYHCTVDFLVDGASQGFVENTTVIVPGLAINDVQVSESAGQATFTVTLSVPSQQPVSVHYGTANGTASAPADYAATAGTLTFIPGQTLKTLSVPIVDDSVDELNETFSVLLSLASGAAVTDPTGVGTILDDDRNGSFSCTATVLRVANLTAVRANPADLPCVDDGQTAAQVQLNAGIVSVRADVLGASTGQTPDNLNTAPSAGDHASAKASVESSRIVAGLVVIEIGVIRSTAAATCASTPSGLAASLTGSSSLASLKINGVPVIVGSAPITIPLTVGTLRINAQTITSTTVVQQAVVLDTLLTDVVIGEAKADIAGTAVHAGGSPCVA
jgi:hypothetical protein